MNEIKTKRTNEQSKLIRKYKKKKFSNEHNRIFVAVFIACVKQQRTDKMTDWIKNGTKKTNDRKKLPKKKKNKNLKHTYSSEYWFRFAPTCHHQTIAFK